MPQFNEQGPEPEDQTQPVNLAALRTLLAFGHRRHVPKRGIIVRSGEPADRLYYLEAGAATVITSHGDEADVVLAYLNAGDFIGELGLFYRSRIRQATVRARLPCELVEISYERLNELLNGELKSERADILYAVGSQLSRRLLQSSRRVMRMAAMDVPDRVAEALLDLCREPTALSHPEGTQLHISQTELASIVGCTREMVARALKMLEQDGRITVSGKNIVVLHDRS